MENLVLNVNEKPKRIRDWILFTIQHILAMFVSCVTVPLVINAQWGGNQVLDIASTIFSAGIGTLLYLIITKFKSPVVLASSFAYLPSIASGLAVGESSTFIASVSEGIPNYACVIIGTVMVGIVYALIALIIKLCGTNWINKIMPPLVIGCIVMVIGLSLSGAAVNNLVGNGNIENYNLLYILVGLFGLVITSLCAHYGNKELKLIPFLIGIVSAYLFACLITGIGYYGFGYEKALIVDFSPIVNNFKDLSFRSFFDYPRFMFLGMTPGSEEIGNAFLSFRAIDLLSSFLLFVPVAFVTASEHISDHLNLSSIIDKDLLKDPGLDKTILGDGIATALGGVCSGVANTTYGENVAVVGVTKVASVYPILCASISLMFLAFFKPLMVIIQTIPGCVMGGVSLVLYGFIASSGIKMLIKNKIDFNETRNIFIGSIILISGIGGLAINFTVSGTDISLTSTAVSLILGIIFNLILKEKNKNKKLEEINNEKSKNIK